MRVWFRMKVRGKVAGEVRTAWIRDIVSGCVLGCMSREGEMAVEGIVRVGVLVSLSIGRI